jgi:hypothetical protein
VRRTVLLLLLLLAAPVACGPNRPRGPMVGAPDARAALDGFLNGVRAQDLQVISNYWGNSQGPARDRLDRAELEKRELTMACYLAHDKVRIIDDSPRTGNRRNFTVELSYGTTSRTTEIVTVQGPSDRWYVENADIRQTQALCEARSRKSGT